jgi:hypothetical protein
MRVVIAAGVLVGLVGSASADHAVIHVARDPVPYEPQPIQRAVDPDEPSVRRGDDQPAGVVVTGGWSAQRGGAEGWVGRIDSEILTVTPPFGKDGAVFGAQIGVEYWQATPSPGERDFGVSMPTVLFGGARVSPFRIVVGGGYDGFLVDHVARTTGFGMFAPIALGQISIDTGDGWHLGVDARVGYRWQLGADDHTRYQLGITLGRSWDPRVGKRARSSVIATRPPR